MRHRSLDFLRTPCVCWFTRPCRLQAAYHAANRLLPAQPLADATKQLWAGIGVGAGLIDCRLGAAALGRIVVVSLPAHALAAGMGTAVESLRAPRYRDAADSSGTDTAESDPADTTESDPADTTESDAADAASTTEPDAADAATTAESDPAEAATTAYADSAGAATTAESDAAGAATTAESNAAGAATTAYADSAGAATTAHALVRLLASTAATGHGKGAYRHD